MEHKRDLSRRRFLAEGAAAALGLWAGGTLAPAPARAAEGEAKEMIDVEEMVRIPAGKFLMGTDEAQIKELCRLFKFHHSWFDSEAPRREVEVAEFHIAKYPVTRGQYARFVRETGRRSPTHSAPPSRGADSAGEGFDLHPVAGVNWGEAKAYAQWAGKRLPTEAEWEKAARGTDGRVWPWGDKFDPQALNWNADGKWDKRAIHTTRVDRFPQGASPFGVWDMCGNIAEWTADGFLGSDNGLIKSAGWLMTQWCNFRPAFQGFSSMPHNTYPYVGFRCAK